MKSIEEQWQGFAAMVFNKMKPAENQVKEMKKAFFAGAWALYCATKEIGMEHVSESEGMVYLDAVEKECQQFKDQMMAEYAERN